MRITLHHPASSYGMPVIIDDQGEPMPNTAGITALRNILKVTQKQLAAELGISVRTMQDIEQGQKAAQANHLNMMGLLLERHEKAKSHGGEIE